MHVLCDKRFPGEMQHAHLFTANRPKHEYHLSPTWWTMSFIAVTHRSMGGELLIGVSNADVSPKPTSTWVTAHAAGHLEHTSQPAGSTAWWRVPFQVLRLIAFFAAWCVWEELSARCLLLSGRAHELDHLGGLPEAVLSCLRSWVRSFPSGWNGYTTVWQTDGHETSRLHRGLCMEWP